MEQAMKTNREFPARLAGMTTALTSVAAVLLLTACGGGGGDSDSSTTSSVSQADAVAMSANSATVPTATTEAFASAVTASQAVVAGALASQTYSCPGGGSAIYTVTGLSQSELNNGTFDAGETYDLTFNSCTGAGGATTVNGSLRLVVTTATSAQLGLSSSTSGLTVGVPQGTVALNGASALNVATTTAGTTTTETVHWQTPNYSVTSVFGARTSTWALSNVDLTQSAVTVNGSLYSTTHGGMATLAVVRPNGAWSITVNFQGGVQFDANGVPQSGSWTVALPYNAITITAASNRVTIAVDWGNDGVIDRTYTYTCDELVNEAG
jgi:hypothetical protein